VSDDYRHGSRDLSSTAWHDRRHQVGQDLVFSIGGKMYAVVCLEPPHTVAFKCTPEDFARLVERDGIIPAPYLARAMWVQEQAIGDALERQELRALLRTSYELVQAKLPERKRAEAIVEAGSARQRRAVKKRARRRR
jgi:predicted DNA-binding protein (MmcQ/YjbR family)